MGEFNVKELLKINDIMQKSERVDNLCEQNKVNYLKTLQKLNASNKHNHIASMAKASQTYIYQSTMGANYYESLSPEMKYLTDNIGEAFAKESDISDKYDEQIFRQIIISNYEIDYVEHVPLQTADIRNANNAYTIKPSNFTFNTYNFFKYLSEIQLLAKEISELDIKAVVLVALWTIAQLKSDMTEKIDKECAHFLHFLYNKIGFGREEVEEEIVKEYMNMYKESDPYQNKEKIEDMINTLAGLKVIEINGGKIRIAEKIIV